MSQESYVFANINRTIAQDGGDEVAGDLLAQEMGLMDAAGSSLTPEALEEKANKKKAHTEKLAGYLEKAKEPPKPAKPSTDTGLEDPLEMKQRLEGEGMSQIMGAAADAIQSVANGGLELADWLDNKFGNGQLIQDDAKFTFANDIFPQSQLPGMNAVRAGSRFAMGFIPALAGVRALGATGNIASSMLAGAATDFMLFEGTEANLSDFVQELPEFSIPAANLLAHGAKQMTSPLAHKEGESELVGRLKNMGEGIGLGLVAEGVALGIRQLGRARSAKAAVKVADEAPTKVPQAEPAAPKIIEENAQTKAVIKEKELDTLIPKAEATKQADLKLLTPEEAQAIPEGTREAGMPNVGRYKESRVSTRSLIQNLAEKNKGAFQAAALRGDEPSKLLPLEKVLKYDTSKIIDDRSVRDSITFYAEQATIHADEICQKIAKGDTSDETLAAFLEAQEWAGELVLRDTQQGSRAGSVLNQRKNMQLGEIELAPGAEKDLIELRGGAEEVIQDAVGLSKLPRKQQRKVFELSKSKKFGRALLEVRASNLLTSPAVWLKNEVGNAISAIAEIPTRALAPYLPTGKTTGGLDEIYKLAGYRTATNESVDAKGLQALFKLERELRAVDTSILSAADVKKHNTKLSRVSNKIKDIALSKAVPGEVLSGMAGAVHTAVDSMSGWVYGMLDAISITRNHARQQGYNLKELAEKFSANPFNKIEFAPVISSKNFGGGKVTDTLGQLQRFSFEVLNRRDNFWKILTYRSELYSTGHRLARMQGFTGDTADAFIKDFVDNPPSWVGEISAKSNELSDFNKLGIATKRAHRATYTEPLDDSFTQQIYDIISNEKVMGVELPAAPLKLFAPFAKTDLNMTKYAMDYSPLAPFTNRYRDAVRMGGAEAQMARARLAVGNSILMATTGLATMGGVTGSGPSDVRMKQIFTKDMGRKEYTISIGGRDFSLDNFGHIGKVMKISADMADLFHHINNGISLEEASEFAGWASWVLVSAFTPEALTDGVGDFIEAVHNKDLGRLASDLPSTMLPFTGHLGLINRAVEDDVKRDTKFNEADFALDTVHGALLKLKEKIPGWSKTLPAEKNMFTGEDIFYPRGLTSSTASILFGMKIDKTDPVYMELIRLGNNGITKETLPEGEHHLAIERPSRYIERDKGRVALDPHQYARYVELVAGKNTKLFKNRKTLHQEIKELVTDPFYGKLKTQEQRNQIKKIIRDAKHRAGDELLMEDGELDKKLTESIKATFTNTKGFKQ